MRTNYKLELNPLAKMKTANVRQRSSSVGICVIYRYSDDICFGREIAFYY